MWTAGTCKLKILAAEAGTCAWGGKTENPLFTLICGMNATAKVAKWGEPPAMDTGAPMREEVVKADEIRHYAHSFAILLFVRFIEHAEG